MKRQQHTNPREDGAGKIRGRKTRTKSSYKETRDLNIVGINEAFRFSVKVLAKKAFFVLFWENRAGYGADRGKLNVFYSGNLVYCDI